MDTHLQYGWAPIEVQPTRCVTSIGANGRDLKLMGIRRLPW
jgi:hypothetical protein